MNEKIYANLNISKKTKIIQKAIDVPIALLYNMNIR